MDGGGWLVEPVRGPGCWCHQCVPAWDAGGSLGRTSPRARPVGSFTGTEVGSLSLGRASLLDRMWVDPPCPITLEKLPTLQGRFFPPHPHMDIHQARCPIQKAAHGPLPGDDTCRNLLHRGEGASDAPSFAGVSIPRTV